MSNAGELSIGRPGDPAAVRSVEIGGVRATYVVDGLLTTHPDTLFPGAPAGYLADMQTIDGELVVSVGGLLVETPRSTVLIDAGAGVMSGRFIFGRAACGTMLDVLDVLGIGVGDIDVVAFTHLHFDHAGWAFVEGLKTFPHARYVLAAQEWAAYARRERDDPGVLARNTLSHLAAPYGGVELVADGAAVAPGVRALVTGGHTQGHTAYVVTSDTGHRLLAFGDAFNSSVQMAHPELVAAADSDVSGVLSARRRLLGELSVPGTIGFGIHFGDQPFGRVLTTAGGAMQWDPIPTLVRLPAPVAVSGGGSFGDRHTLSGGPW